MGSSLMLMLMLKWVALSICFIVFVVELDMALGSDGLCEASAKILQGYECTEFHVTTKDGFILSITRIPQGRSGNDSAKTRPPVFLQHGIVVDGMSWMLGTAEESLALALADNGFDVWLSNGRGTRFSMGHEAFNSTQPKYWDWSWDEIVQYDLPAMLDLVYQQTGQKVHYVGHSMGTLIMLAALSQGMLQDRVSSASLLCPIAYLNKMTSQLGIIASDAFFGEVVLLLGIDEIDPPTYLKTVQLLPNGKVVVELAKKVTARLGFDLEAVLAKFIVQNCCLSKNAFFNYVNNGLQPISTKCLVHFAQTFRSGVVMKYDYGSPMLNMKHYGQPRPPVYNLKNISKSVPLFLSYGGNDDLADVNDVLHLVKDLSSHDPVKINSSFVKEYGHLDYLLSYNAKEKAYNTMIDFLKAQSS